MYDFLASFDMHGTCICVFGFLIVNGVGFARCDYDFSLAFPFLNSHGVIGIFHLVDLWIVEWFWKWVRWSQENSQGPRDPLTSNSGIAVNPEG